jgi:hypothetical protein
MDESELRGGLAPPEKTWKDIVYEARRVKPARVMPETLEQYKTGMMCANCHYARPLAEGQRRLASMGFWDRLFKPKDDGSEIKPMHTGELEQYTTCPRRRDAVSIFASACEHFRKAWK